jgi:transcriptional regulator with XRE-family HTH domain
MNLRMNKKCLTIDLFLKDLMKRRKLLPRHLASELNVSHATVSRWISGKDKPSVKSCQRLAEFSCVHIDQILAIAGHLPEIRGTVPADWPEFREYALLKYADELDDDLITMIEDLIERRREKRNARKGKRS